MTNKTNPTILIKPKIIKIIPKCELNASLPGKFNALKSIRAAKESQYLQIPPH